MYVCPLSIAKSALRGNPGTAFRAFAASAPGAGATCASRFLNAAAADSPPNPSTARVGCDSWYEPEHRRTAVVSRADVLIASKPGASR